MSRCLNEYELQAVADDEAPAGHRAHVDACAACAGRLAARRRLTERAVAAAESLNMTGAARARMRTRIVDGPGSGATTLRDVRKTPRWAWGVPLTAAALLVYFVVVPGIDRQTTVSAAEVLGRSQAALAARSSGVEVLKYDLDLEGVLGDLVPDEQAGRFTVEEIIDHDHEGSYRIVKVGPDGVVAGAADDTVSGIRTRYLKVKGRGFLLRFEGAGPTAMSVIALKKSMLQIFIGLMQTSSTQTLRELDRAGEHCYEISIPGIAVPATSLISLEKARAVITAADSRLVEFSAAGTLSGRPFSVEFALRSRDFGHLVAVPQPFYELKPGPGDVVLEGNATENPLWDVLARVFEAVPSSPAPSRRP